MHHACGEQYRSAESQRMESSGGTSQRAIALQTLTIPYLENPTGGRKMWNIRQLMRALSMRGGHKLLQYSSCGRSPQKRRREAAENTGGDVPSCIIKHVDWEHFEGGLIQERGESMASRNVQSKVASAHYLYEDPDSSDSIVVLKRRQAALV